MEYIRQTISGNELSRIFEIPPELRDKEAEVIILFPPSGNLPKKPKTERKFDFLKDKVPPLPDSFFDPLPEEDLQAWGL